MFSVNQFRKLLTAWVVHSDQPFTVVEEPPFKTLVEFCRPGIKIGSADTLKRDVMKEFAASRAQVIEELSVLQLGYFASITFIHPSFS